MGVCLSKSKKSGAGASTAGLARTASSYDGAHTNPLRVPESDGAPKPDPKSASELYKSETMQQRIKAAENAQRPA